MSTNNDLHCGYDITFDLFCRKRNTLDTNTNFKSMQQHLNRFKKKKTVCTTVTLNIKFLICRLNVYS